MCKLKFLLTATCIKLGVFFFGRYLASSRKVVKPKKRPRRRSHANFTSDLEHSDIFSVWVFFYVHVFCGMPFNEKQTAYWKSLKFVALCFSNFWSLSNHKWRRQQQWHLTKGFTCTLAFSFCTFIRFYMQINKTAIIRSSRFENRNN